MTATSKPEPGETLEQYRVRRVGQILMLAEHERKGYGSLVLSDLMDLIDTEYKGLN